MAGSSQRTQTALGWGEQLGRAAPVSLGALVLSGPEVPDELVFGGRQLLAVHHALGGGRIIDSVGNEPTHLVLTGRFIGPQASRRARRVEAMRVAAKRVTFSVADMSVRVWIAEFSWSYRARGTICPYRLVLEPEDRPPVQVASSAESADTAMQAGLDVITRLRDNMTIFGWTEMNKSIGVIQNVTPVAQSLSVGDVVAKVQTALGTTSAVLKKGMNSGRLPSVVKSVTSALPSISDDLAFLQSESEAVLSMSSVKSVTDVLSLTQGAGVATFTKEASSYVHRAQSLLSDLEK